MLDDAAQLLLGFPLLQFRLRTKVYNLVLALLLTIR
jgi:hypothetical protein